MDFRTTTWLCLVVVQLLAGPALADRYHVRSGGTRTAGPSAPGNWDPADCYATLAAAALEAAPADSLLLYPEAHVCDVPVTLPAFLGNRDLTATADQTVVAFSGAGRLVADAPAVEAGLQGIILTGGAILEQAGLTVTSSAGGSYAMALRGCVFQGFRAQGPGVVGGAAVRAAPSPGSVDLQVDDCEFTDNQTEGPGGAVHLAADVEAAFVNCLFDDNASTGPAGRGGALSASADGEPTAVVFTDCDFENNASGGPGGAIGADNVSLELVGCRVEGSRSGVGATNDWSAGAGIHLQRSIGLSGPVRFVAAGCEFRDNLGDMQPLPTNGDGGAVLVKGRYSDVVEVDVSRCTFTGNANAQGAGLYVGRFAAGRVAHCSFVGNRAWYQGGGAMKGGALGLNTGEHLVLDYCEFVGNEAGFTAEGVATGEYSRGGGLMVRNRPRATVRHCTFVDNRVNDSAYAVGDGLAHAKENLSWLSSSLLVIQDSVFWGESGNGVQLHSENGGVAEAARLALLPGEIIVPEPVQVDLVFLTAFPFSGPADLVPAEGSPLIDQGGATEFPASLGDVAVPQGAAPDIGAYERPDGLSGVADVPSAERLMAAYPNPFNPRTLITATLPTTGECGLVVHDLRGRPVARLHRGPLAAGRHAWTWEGRDDAGRDLPAGVYLARITGPDLDETCKLALVR